MIRQRMMQLDSAADRAIEALRASMPMEEIARAVLDLLAPAASSHRATYWVIDTERQRLRPIAAWNASASPPAGPDVRHRPLSLSLSNAGHVWRSRKPLWSTSLLLDVSLPTAGDGADAGLHGGVWFALKSDTAMYAVIELVGRAFEPKTPENLTELERLGFRLGYALEELWHGRERLH